MSLAAVAPRRDPRSAPIEEELTLSHSTLYLSLSLSLSLLCQATFDSSSTSYRCLQLGVRLINEGCRFISKLSELRTTRAVLPRCVPKIQLTFCAVMTHNLARTPEKKELKLVYPFFSTWCASFGAAASSAPASFSAAAPAH